MSKISYDNYAERYEKTKPIRGRSTDIRPIGERRRDWETITKKALDEGMWSYSAKLHSTECVEYLPNGDIILRSGGWPTPTTAEFIHIHSPFTCWKQGGKLWVRAVKGMGGKEVTAYPLGNELRMNWKGEHNYEPATKVMVNKRVVDRAKAKAAREPLQPFLNFAKTMLKLSDGWVMHETAKEVLGWGGEKAGEYVYKAGHPYFMSESDIYKMLTEQADVEPEHVYMKAICILAQRHIDHNERREAEVFPFEVTYSGGTYQRKQQFWDYQIDFERLKRKIYAMVESREDVHNIIEVEPTSKGMYGTV